jgi:hypothetical protein
MKVATILINCAVCRVGCRALKMFEIKLCSTFDIWFILHYWLKGKYRLSREYLFVIPEANGVKHCQNARGLCQTVDFCCSLAE